MTLKFEIEPVVIKAQNVRDYYVEHFKEHNWHDLRTFTCVKPPFEEMIITFQHTFYGHGMKDQTFLGRTAEEIIEAGNRGELPCERTVDIAVTRRSVEYFSRFLRPEHIPGWN